MKTVRMFPIALAVVLFVAAFVPFAATPVAAQESATLMSSSAQSFLDAARGLPLLAPLSGSAPYISLSVENTTSNSYSCTLVRQNPSDWVKMKTRQVFDMFWTVQNTGAVWHEKTTKFAYVYGTKFQTRASEFRLGQDVGKGQKIKFGVDMTAPKALGTYTALWSLSTGNTSFCRVTLVLTVIR